ncbi:MAG: NADH-quinone oxidoreductase subunit C [Betaproteobacteria bacterium]|nr:NADH-quinone oxidoreductase subunit C [Betaproteobacteria bacterium]
MRHCDTARLSPAELPGAADALLTALGDIPSAHGRMQMAYACGGNDGGLDVIYVVSTPRSPQADPAPHGGEAALGRPSGFLGSQGANQPYKIWRVRPRDHTLPSLADKLPLLGWYEREMMDLYGLRFTDHPEPNPLVLHEGMPREPAPFAHGFDIHAAALDFTPQPPIVPQVLGHDIQRLPFGPVRADIVESAQFLFFYIGEGILHYHPRLFYKHRAMEARFQGADARTGSALAERVSGIDSVAHALAFAQAVEGAMGWRAPPRSRYLRVILAELERLYNHLHYLGRLSKTTTLKVGEAQGLLLEERLKQINGKLTGSRFLRGLITPGGLRRDLDVSGLDAALDTVADDIDSYLQRLENTRSHLDRLMTTGHLDRQVAFDQGACGPIERASGLDRDLRRDHPYASYDKVRFSVSVQQGGDAHARSLVRMEEIRESLAIVRQVIGRVKPGPVLRGDVMEEPDPQGEGLGWAEAARGGLLYAVHLDATRTRLQRVKIKDPSFSNWRVFPFTVEDSNMMDYAINEASFGLSVAGADR